MLNIPFQFDSSNVLDLKDLLPSIPVEMVVKVVDKKEPLSTDEEVFLQNMTKATENANSPILAGISAIGELIAHGAEEVSTQTITNIGWLINSLGEQAFALNNLKEEANAILKHNKLHKVPTMGAMS